jgi:DNA-directed RNA polymerase subunit RPC12/RpoP
MKPIGWTAESMRARCEQCGQEVELEWGTYFDALEQERPVTCDACGTEQPMRDRRQRDESVPVDRRRPG